MIVPIQHKASTALLEEEEKKEIRDYIAKLKECFAKKNKFVLFFFLFFSSFFLSSRYSQENLPEIFSCLSATNPLEIFQIPTCISRY